MEVSSFIKESQLGSKSLETIQPQTGGNLIQSYLNHGYRLPNYSASVRTVANESNQIKGTFLQRHEAQLSLPQFLSNYVEEDDSDSLIISPTDLHSGNCVIVSIIGTKIQTESFSSIAIPLPDPKVQLSANSKSMLSGMIPLTRMYSEYTMSHHHTVETYSVIPRRITTMQSDIVGITTNESIKVQIAPEGQIANTPGMKTVIAPELANFRSLGDTTNQDSVSYYSWLSYRTMTDPEDRHSSNIKAYLTLTHLYGLRCKMYKSPPIDRLLLH